MERLKKRQQQGEEKGIPVEAGEDEECPLGDQTAEDIRPESQFESATEMRELQESHSEKSELKHEDVNSTGDKPCSPDSQVSDIEGTAIPNNQKSERTSPNPLCEQVSSAPVPADSSQTEEAHGVQRSPSVEEAELPVSTPTRGQPNKSTFKRKAPQPPSQKQQQTQKEAGDQSQQNQGESQSPRTTQQQLEAQNKVKRRAPIPPAQNQPDKSRAESQKKQKRKAPVPATGKQTESSPRITVNQKPVPETKEDQQPHSAVVSIETASSAAIRKEKRKAPQRPQAKSRTPEKDTRKTQRPVTKSRTPEKDTSKTQRPVAKSRTPERGRSKANQTNEMEELTKRNPRVRRRKEKAPQPPQPAATQPVSSKEERAWAEKQLKETRAEEKKPKLLTVPVDKPLFTLLAFRLLFN